MAIVEPKTETTYNSLRENVANTRDQVTDQQETFIVRRNGSRDKGSRDKGSQDKGSRDVALVPARELAGLMETAHLLRSPGNARRLLTALHRAETGKTKGSTAAALRREILGDVGA